MNKHSFVLFVGPSCSNKTLHYEQEYKSTHERISLVEWKQQDEKISLHAMFRRIISKLNNNVNVVVDDENLAQRTRESLMKKIKEGVKNVKISCIYFKNIGGLKQCLWQNEIKLAENFNTKFGLNVDRAEKELKDLEVPTKVEGYDEIIEIETKLTVIGRSIDFNNSVCEHCIRILTKLGTICGLCDNF